MPRRYGPIAGLVVALVIGAAGFIGLSERVYPFTESLQRVDSLEEEIRGNSSSVLLQFHNEDESVTLAADVRIYQLDNNMYGLSVRSSHTEGVDTKLDSLDLTLNVARRSLPEVALRTPGGHPWEPIHLQQTTDGQGVTLEVPDLGFQGTGTVSLDFLVGPYQPDDIPESIWVDFNAGLHREERIQLTSYEADSLVEVPMPAGEESDDESALLYGRS